MDNITLSTSIYFIGYWSTEGSNILVGKFIFDLRKTFVSFFEHINIFTNQIFRIFSYQENIRIRQQKLIQFRFVQFCGEFFYYMDSTSYDGFLVQIDGLV